MSDCRKMNRNFRPINITAEQYEQLRLLQEQIGNDWRALGYRPTLHHIARQMIDKGVSVFNAEISQQHN